MIPILKNDTETLGFLTDALSCSVTEERNGIFELAMTYPITGQMASQLVPNNLILAKPNDTAEDQLFRIYEVTKPMSGVITVMAEHISYALSNYPVTNINLSSTTAQAAISRILSSTTEGAKFSAYSDITFRTRFAVEACTMRAALGGMAGSVLDCFGGEYEFNNYAIRLLNNRGRDNGVFISYGKNLTDCTMVVNTENAYTDFYPYAYDKSDPDNPVLVTLAEKTIEVYGGSDRAKKVYMKDLTELFGDDEAINEDNLRAYAYGYVLDVDLTSPTINLSVSFQHLWQSPEYTELLKALEKVSLCDTVHVFHQPLGIDVKAKVISTVYDTLSEQYEKIEIGNAKSNFADTIVQTNKEVETIKQNQGNEYSKITGEYLAAIEESSKLITGNSGGYVVLTPTNQPQELLIMNRSSISTATKLWRFNLNGLGYSSTGYNGTYRTAITMNGAINADFITTGTLTANIIRTGLLASVDYSSSFDLESGRLETSDAYITGGYISIGSGTYRTVIQNGSIKQYLSSSTEVGGMIPIGSGNTYYNGIYASKASNVAGVSIFYEGTDNALYTVAQFGKSAINLYKSTSISGNLTVFGGYVAADNTLYANNDASDTYAGLRTYRTRDFDGAGTQWTALAYFAIGNVSKSPTLALDLRNYGSDHPSARLDLFPSSGEAYICLRGSAYGSNSKLLELGAQLWWGGPMNATKYNVSSIEEIKEDITEQKSVVDIFKKSKIFNYKLIDDSEEKLDDNQASLVPNSDKQSYLIEASQSIKDKIQQAIANSNAFSKLERKTSVGFVIGRNAPSEVISEDGKHIDLYSMASITWKAVQEILERLDKIDSEIAAMKGD